MKPLNILVLVIKKLFESSLEQLRVSARVISVHKSAAVCSFAIQWEWDVGVGHLGNAPARPNGN